VANTSTFNWTVTGTATIAGGNGLDTVLVDWGTSGGTVCLVAENGCGTSPQECITVTTTSQPNITATDPPTACAPDPFDLNTIMISNSGGGFGLITFYDNLTDALAGTNDLIPPTTNTSGTYYIRMATGPDCYDIDSAVVEIEDPQLVVVDPAFRCSPNTLDLVDVVINEVNGYAGGVETFYTDSLDAVAGSSALTSTVISTGGTYWVRYETPGGCAVVERINVVIDVTPDITLTNPAPLCPGGTIDLNTIPLTDNNAAIYTKHFFNNQTLARDSSHDWCYARWGYQWQWYFLSRNRGFFDFYFEW